LKSGAAATLTDGTKSQMRQIQSTVNSTGVQIGARETANFVGTFEGGQAKEILGPSGISTGNSNNSFAPADATRIQKPVLDLELFRKR
jgi:hypothetical protein